MADRTPVEVRLMIMDELLAIKIEENPQIHQVKIIQNSVTGVFNISFYGDTKQPNVLSIERYTREQAKKHYIKVFDRLPVGCQPSGGYWMRPKDIVYIDAQFSRGLHYIQRLNLGNITRVAIDVQVVDEDATGFESAMDKLMTFFPDIRHLVFFAPTQPNPVGNRYRGLRLVNELEDEVHKRLPLTNFYRAGGSTGRGSGIAPAPASQHALMFLNQHEPQHSRKSIIRWYRRVSDEFERALRAAGPVPVVIFQRQGMLAPREMKVVGPSPSSRPALCYTAYRVRPERITEADVTALLEQAEIPPATW